MGLRLPRSWCEVARLLDAGQWVGGESPCRAGDAAGERLVHEAATRAEGDGLHSTEAAVASFGCAGGAVAGRAAGCGVAGLGLAVDRVAERGVGARGVPVGGDGDERAEGAVGNRLARDSGAGVVFGGALGPAVGWAARRRQVAGLDD